MKKISPKNIVIKSLESILVTGYILFEEIVWNVFAQPIFEYFKSFRVLESLKKIFLGMNRHAVLAVFIFILAITELLGLLSGFSVINGYIFLGIFIYALKIPVAAFTFWLFDLTNDQLMTFPWLKTTYEFIMGLIDNILNSPIHVYIKTRVVSLRTKMKQLSLSYFGDEGFIASIKSHYAIYSSYAHNVFKTTELFRTSKKPKSFLKRSTSD